MAERAEQLDGLPRALLASDAVGAVLLQPPLRFT